MRIAIFILLSLIGFCSKAQVKIMDIWPNWIDFSQEPPITGGKYLGDGYDRSRHYFEVRSPNNQLRYMCNGVRFFDTSFVLIKAFIEQVDAGTGQQQWWQNTDSFLTIIAKGYLGNDVYDTAHIVFLKYLGKTIPWILENQFLNIPLNMATNL